MAITPRSETEKPAPRPPVEDESAAAGFIQRAPDAKAARARKVQISFSLPAPLLDALDALAASTGQSRAFHLNNAVAAYLKQEGRGV